MIRSLLILALGLAVSGCSRPLTEAEEAFADDLFGGSLDTSKVRVARGLGFLPLHRTVPADVTLVEGTDQACLRTPQPRGAQPPQAFALYHWVHFENGLYSSDMATEWPDRLRLPQALVFAHELTHVWQWQNRDVTGYTPGRAVAESIRLADPYYSAGEAEFFSFGYEQQAALVEDYICFAFANPDHPRREELRAIIDPVLSLDRFDAAIAE